MQKTIIFSVLVLFVTSLQVISTGAEEISSLAEGRKIYRHYCAMCHGNKGNGKGFNAKNLDPRPANHADRELMGRRSDKDLSDAVIGGGKMVGKATLMPPWGEVFSKEQIDSLVIYMRKLCKCSGT